MPRRSGSFLFLLPLLLAASPSLADTFGFGCVTNNLAGDCAIGQSQLSVDVTNPGSNRIDFTFHNVGSAASSLAQAYWDDGALASIFSIMGSSGVSFASPATPSNLPGGSSVTPPFVATFSVGANNPAPTNGVNPGESLTVRFNLASGQTFASAIQAIDSGALRIGVHVQSFASGGSEGFVNVIPEPGTFALLGGGLLSLALARRRRSDR
jgi:PEP-CTERM motif-containing protein